MDKNNQFVAVKDFIKHNFRHFNAATVVDAADEYVNQINQGNKMLVTLAGAMSTAELGISLAEMIRKDKIHAISCTAANLEEDIFNLVAHNEYRRIKDWRALSAQDEDLLLQKNLNRVTDTCIPEEEAMRKIEKPMIELWQQADKSSKRYFPYEYFYQLLQSEKIKDSFQIDPKNSWVMAAMEKNLPIFTDRKSTRLNSSHTDISRMPSSA